ncbi:hypothetical protein [Reinekea sp. G2M2-21]|uniref:hypothetical protein n=1 Tax=Reinekea sp. G2M2-21 TaxID=2788942 RepID=UPI001E5F0343|nr:hypothetical protein [Reinekea sp. G2M2-21]
MNFFKEIRESLTAIGLPESDMWHLPESTMKFSDGSDYRIEIPTINSLKAAEEVLEESIKQGITINRLTETAGIFNHTHVEIESLVKLCKDYGCELVMSPGPRASNDTGASFQTDQGSTIAYRLRGQEQLVRAIADVQRAIDLGVDHFVIYDEGMLYALGELRKSGYIPSNVHFKVSAHCGHGNPASFKLLQDLGANSINPVRDLQLPMLSSIRSVTSIPIDCHTDNPKSSGGFVRFYDAPEFVRLLSPVYLKCGNSSLKFHGHETSQSEARSMVRKASIVTEIIEREYPQASQSLSGSNVQKRPAVIC